MLTPPAFAGGVSITSFGHSSLLVKGGGKSILLNPFKAVGCASRLKEPNLNVDIVLASSELADEGARVARGVFLVKPGSYRIGKMKIEGFSVDHDRLDGRRFGKGTVWQWQQGGVDFAHLGGVAGALNAEQRLLLGNPDVLIIAVGGGVKVYNAQEAERIIRQLRPKHVIPVQYLTKSSPESCELEPINSFLDLMEDAEIINAGKTLSISKIDSENLVVNILN